MNKDLDPPGILVRLATFPALAPLGRLRRHIAPPSYFGVVGARLLDEGRLAEAVKLYATLIQLQSSDHEVGNALRVALARHADHDDVDAILGQLGKDRTTDSPIVKQRMHFLRRQRRHDAAIRVGEEFLRRHPQSPDVLAELATSLARSGRVQDGLSRIQAYHDENGAPIELLEAGLDVANRHAPEAVASQWAKLVLAHDPQSAVALIWMYKDLTRKNDEEAARNVALSVKHLPGKPIRPIFDSVFNSIRSNENQHAASLLTDLEGTKALAYERKLVSALLAMGNDDLLRAGRLVSEAAGDSNADHRLAVVLLQLAQAHLAQEGAQGTGNAKKLKAWGEKVFSEPLPPASLAKFREVRRKLDEILTTQASQQLLRDQPALVSLICPVHRSRDVANLVSQIQRQKWINAEAVFYPNGEVTKDEILEHWDHDCKVSPVFVESGNPSNLGDILNEAITASRGEYVCRFDADSWYFPNYVGNAICCLEHADADIIAKATRFRLLEEWGATTLNTQGPTLEPGEHRNAGGGGTMLFRRSVFNKTKFASISAGEDTLFLASSQNDGARLFYGDPFNFVSIRFSDKNLHTWKVPDAQILLQRRTDVFRNGQEFFNMVQHPPPSEL